MAPSPLLPKENGAIVLRTKVDPQPTRWEAILPPEFSALPPGLARIDRLLDDPATGQSRRFKLQAFGTRLWRY
jgi:hypothetical protein